MTAIPKNALPKDDKKDDTEKATPGTAPEGTTAALEDAQAKAATIIAEATAEAKKIREEAAANALTVANQAEQDAKAIKSSAASAAKTNEKKSGITRIFNRMPSLQYVGDTRILPDDVGTEFSDELHEAALKNPGYAALIKQKKLEVV